MTKEIATLPGQLPLSWESGVLVAMDEDRMDVLRVSKGGIRGLRDLPKGPIRAACFGRGWAWLLCWLGGGLLCWWWIGCSVGWRTLQHILKLSGLSPHSADPHSARPVCYASTHAQAVIFAPNETPYACGAFAFDILLPPDYPNRAPQVCRLVKRCCRFRYCPRLGGGRQETHLPCHAFPRQLRTAACSDGSCSTRDSTRRLPIYKGMEALLLMPPCLQIHFRSNSYTATMSHTPHNASLPAGPIPHNLGRAGAPQPKPLRGGLLPPLLLLPLAMVLLLLLPQLLPIMLPLLVVMIAMTIAGRSLLVRQLRWHALLCHAALLFAGAADRKVLHRLALSCHAAPLPTAIASLLVHASRPARPAACRCWVRGLPPRKVPPSPASSKLPAFVCLPPAAERQGLPVASGHVVGAWLAARAEHAAAGGQGGAWGRYRGCRSGAHACKVCFHVGPLATRCRCGTAIRCSVLGGRVGCGVWEHQPACAYPSTKSGAATAAVPSGYHPRPSLPTVQWAACRRCWSAYCLRSWRLAYCHLLLWLAERLPSAVGAD